MSDVVVTGSFDDLRLADMRFLDAASQIGPLHVVLWSDHAAERLDGRRCKFPEQERLYFLQAIRYVASVRLSPDRIERDTLPPIDGLQPTVWAANQAAASEGKRAWCRANGLQYRVIREAEMPSLYAAVGPIEKSSRKRVVVTGCYDWLHSGHVRFFEEVSQFGDLYAIVGHDANIRLLKGGGHPMFPEAVRRYMVQSIRYVKRAMISSGHGWMDGEPEFLRIAPDIYAVNEDGHRPEKQRFCEEHGIEYRVLKRVPKEGLPARQSTILRGGASPQ